MLQQTQVATVLDFYDRFINRFPDIESVAHASEREIVSLWAGLGYYTRARNLHRTARLILEKHHGVFPHEIQKILELPGIGSYTAAAICSIAFNQPQAAVDGNIRRVITRIHGIRIPASDSFFRHQVSEWIPEGRASDFNQALMELGALVCTPFHPHCPVCPVRMLCQACRLGIQHKIPLPRAVNNLKTYDIVLVVLERRSQFLLVLGDFPEFIPGEWGLPSQIISARSKPDETAGGLVQSIFNRKLPVQQYTRFRHSITNRRLRVHVYYANADSSDFLRKKQGFLMWADKKLADRLLVSSIFIKALNSLRHRH
jgi:A/G-specific adenine glycosylase